MERKKVQRLSHILQSQDKKKSRNDRKCLPLREIKFPVFLPNHGDQVRSEMIFADKTSGEHLASFELRACGHQLPDWKGITGVDELRPAMFLP